MFALHVVQILLVLQQPQNGFLVAHSIVVHQCLYYTGLTSRLFIYFANQRTLRIHPFEIVDAFKSQHHIFFGRIRNIEYRKGAAGIES